jgi:exodeoxyribonuclease VII large subunit
MFKSILNTEPLSVSDVTAMVKSLIEGDDRLVDVRVQGEISNLARPASGHIYFTLKDAKSQIKCAMWKTQVVRMRSIPQNGDSVVARGRVNVYERDGVYQLYVDAMTPIGQGDLSAEFERLKSKLQAEGLFDRPKRELPEFPRIIGVVTSPSAAAYQDILNVLRRRFPIAEVLLSPTSVQGEEAPAQIVRAIERFDSNVKPDVILVARGGGSLEELWAFNDERVARAVAASVIPVVSGVGHEIDFTLTDFAADVRAPTPSAAAELVTPDVNDLRLSIDALSLELDRRTRLRLQGERVTLNEFQRALRLLSPKNRLDRTRETLIELKRRVDSAFANRTILDRTRLESLHARLNAISPDATLARGYAIVRRKKDGGFVRSVKDVHANDALRIRVSDGEIDAQA